MSDPIPFLGALPAIDLAAYNPFKEENTKEWASLDTFIHSAARASMANPLLSAFGTPQIFSAVGLISNAFKEEDAYWRKGLNLALFAASLIPFYGNFVDLGYAGVEVYQNGFTFEAGMYLASAAIGFSSSGLQAGRLMKMSHGLNGLRAAMARSNINIAYLRLATNVQMVRARKAAWLVNGIEPWRKEILKALDVSDEAVEKLMQDLAKDVKPAVELAGDGYLETIKQSIRRHLSYPNRSYEYLDYLCDVEVLRQLSRGGDPWFSVGRWSFNPRPLYMAPGTFHRNIGQFWKNFFDYGKLGNIRFLFRGKNTVWGQIKRARNKQDFPLAEITRQRYFRSSKEVLIEIIKDLRRKFPDQFIEDSLGVVEKPIGSLLTRLQDGKIPFDICRSRLIGQTVQERTANENMVAITHYLIKEYGAIPTQSLSRAVHLEPGKAYRATHLVIPHSKGVVELQLGGPQMVRWKHIEDEAYKAKAVNEQLYRDGIEAFESDGGYHIDDWIN